MISSNPIWIESNALVFPLLVCVVHRLHHPHLQVWTQLQPPIPYYKSLLRCYPEDQPPANFPFPQHPPQCYLQTGVRGFNELLSPYLPL